MNARNAMGVIKILEIIPKLSLNIGFVASYSDKSIFRPVKNSSFYYVPRIY